MPVTPIIRRRREHIVREHMESENRHEFDVTMKTFAHPSDELMATGQVYGGPEQVADYFEQSRREADRGVDRALWSVVRVIAR